MNKNIIIDLLKNGKENENVDFKSEMYRWNIPKKRIDFIKDILSMANTYEKGNKYIIIGANDNGQFVLLDESIEVKKQSEYEQIIRDNIEPNLQIKLHQLKIDNNQVYCFEIINPVNKPYFVIKDTQLENKQRGLEKGDCFIRTNSIQVKISRHDLDSIYQKHSEFYNLKLFQLNLNKDEYSSELLLIHSINALLKRVLEINSSINLFKHNFENTINGYRETRVIYRDQTEIIRPDCISVLKNIVNEVISFTPIDLNLDNLYNLLKKCNYLNYKYYADYLVYIDFEYQLMKKNLSIVSKIKNFSVATEFNKILSILANVSKSSWSDMPSEPINLEDMVTKEGEGLLNYASLADRENEIKKQLDKIYLEIQDLELGSLYNS